jgi:hypothetical protein
MKETRNKEKQMKRIVTMLVMIGLVGSAMADTRWFTGDGSWLDSNNWFNGQAPQPTGLDDLMLFPNGGTSGLSQCDRPASLVAITYNPSNTGTVELELVSGGALTWTTEAWPEVGTRAGKVDKLTINGGTMNVTAGPWLAIGSAGSGVLTMESGTLTTGNLRVDWDLGAVTRGVVNMNGGTIDLSGLLQIGNKGIVNMSGGQIICRNKDYTPTLLGYVNSGLITGITTSDVYYDGTDTYVIPEPATLSMLAFAAGGVMLARKRFSI